jgi:hypothetical protein
MFAQMKSIDEEPDKDEFLAEEQYPFEDSKSNLENMSFRALKWEQVSTEQQRKHSFSSRHNCN